MKKLEKVEGIDLITLEKISDAITEGIEIFKESRDERKEREANCAAIMSDLEEKIRQCRGSLDELLLTPEEAVEVLSKETLECITENNMLFIHDAATGGVLPLIGSSVDFSSVINKCLETIKLFKEIPQEDYKKRYLVSATTANSIMSDYFPKRESYMRPVKKIGTK